MSDMGMKIIRLEANNVKRLSAVEIAPTGDVIEIMGDNGAGKSSVIDAIWMCLGGKRAIPPEPIRKGQSESVATLEVGDLIITRKITAKGAYLDVRNSDGEIFKSPQTMLDELVGELTFDPGEFERMEPAEQCRTLLQLLGIQEQLDALDAREKQTYEDRRTANVRQRDETAAAEKIDVPPGTPDKPVSIAELAAELQRRIDSANAYDAAEKRRAWLLDRRAELQRSSSGITRDWHDDAEAYDECGRKIASSGAEAEEIGSGLAEAAAARERSSARLAVIRQQLKEEEAKFGEFDELVRSLSRRHEAAATSCTAATEQRGQLAGRIEKYKKALETANSEVKKVESEIETCNAELKKSVRPDVDEIQKQIENAEKTNEAVSLLRERNEHARLAVEWQTRHAEFEERIEAIRAERVRIIQEAKWPIPGLSIVGTTLYYNQVPYEQCSSSERLKISVSIAMALNPKLRVVLVRDGSLFDGKRLRELYEIVKGCGCQIWIERVGTEGATPGECSVIIEDGHVRE